MKYKENDEIWIKARIESYNAHRTDSFLPYHVAIEANGKNSDGFLTYINISDKCETKPVEEKCSCYVEENNKQRCNGTKEREECSCEGDLSKCNFYPERREMRYTSVAEEDYFPKYANIYNSFLNHIYGLKYYELLDIFDLPDHRFNNKAEILMELIMRHRPVELIRIYNSYRKQFVVCKNDVIEEVKDKKEYLVTKIENQYIHIISKDGDVRVSEHKYLTDKVYKKTGKNMTIQEFFSKEVQA